MDMTQITSSNYKNYDSLDIVAFSCASPGAMGDGGAIIVVTTDGNIYYANPCKGDISEEEALEICPPMKECRFGMFGGGDIPEGWRSFYLGCGNHLVINDNIAAQFHELVEREVNQNGGHLYNKWLDIVSEIIKAEHRKK